QQGSIISRTHPHHLTASRPPFGLKVVGRREHMNVIRNPRETLNTSEEEQKMDRWYELSDIEHEPVKFAVVIAKFKNQFIIIYNKKRGGWEIPGGNREKGEALLHTASRELFEETGAVRFELIPFGIYQWNESLGMVFFAEVQEIDNIPDFEIDEIKFEDALPEGMNFGNMFYIFVDKWNEIKDKKLKKYNIDIKYLNKVNELEIV
ncbi:NUDIX domain-containing protein, partial [Cohnella suwonensis]